VKNGELKADMGYIGSPPREITFKRELNDELARLRFFLGLET
jgi:hypothetical protein